ncbi:MAG: hypothetical protein ACKOFK_05000, partial [Betaproteobacteria bacterium]
ASAAQGLERLSGRLQCLVDVLRAVRGAWKVGRVEWSLSGEHNQFNALAEAAGLAAAAGAAGALAAVPCGAVGFWAQATSSVAKAAAIHG